MKTWITTLAFASAALFATAGQATTHKEAPMVAPGASAAAPMGGSCDTQAADKKLAGAAKTSFLKKCNKDSMAANPAAKACDMKAAEKKLAGAAKNSFVKKCVADAKPA
jgi:hypothetical protein